MSAQSRQDKTSMPASLAGKAGQVQPAAVSDEVPVERRYSISVHRGHARSRVRYVETSDPSKGCRFL